MARAGARNWRGRVGRRATHRAGAGPPPDAPARPAVTPPHGHGPGAQQHRTRELFCRREAGQSVDAAEAMAEANVETSV
ncbi:hypothetical protein GCM10010313_72010 [Streptomyces violarus]|nr:hypothetical protein GCM10010313_72010 [Streptomyces violarus]